MNARQHEPEFIAGESPAFLDLLDRVSGVAALDRPVLIVGERGTGKELIAARLHFLSRRWGERLVKLNCAALPETLLESELFGYEAGAFTGAQKSRAGRFEAADGGTLFLDEIGTMSPAAQEKLLRIIEYGTFERLGSDEMREVDVRILGATNVDLPQMADTGGFRHDLLDRLSFDVLTVPPLRARKDDIPVLIRHFAQAMAAEMGLETLPVFTSAAHEALLDYAWPGNVRELKNVVERAVYRASEQGGPIDELDFDPFDSPYRPPPPPGAQGERQAEPPEQTAPARSKEAMPVPGKTPADFRKAVDAFETAILERAMRACRHNRKRAADHLGLTYDQLRHLLKKHGL